MKPLTAIMLLFALTGLARAATTPSACASLCGDWRLDAAASDKPEQLLDAAFLQFKEPKARRQSIPNTDNSWKPCARPPMKTRWVRSCPGPAAASCARNWSSRCGNPGSLIISGNAGGIRIAGDGSSSMGITPGEHSSRVDRYGTARIRSRWRGSQLAVREKYDRRNQQETTYSTGSDGALRVTQVIARPGLPRITVRSVYRKP